MLRLCEANNFTRGPILLVEASSRRLWGRVGLLPGMAWGERSGTALYRGIASFISDEGVE